MLSLVGLGLGNEKDLTLRGQEVIASGDDIYAEYYTSRHQCTLEELERICKKKITIVDRTFVEGNITTLITRAKKKHVVLLVVGSPTAATTHIEYLLEAHKQNVTWQVVENASVLTAVGLTGLSLYKFGRVTTVPLQNKNITSPYKAYTANKKMGLHTLFLLDITPEKMMTVREGLDYLLRQGLPKKTIVVACAALGSSKQKILVGCADTLAVEGYPQCFVIPGDLHFKEKEALEMWGRSPQKPI